MARQPPTPPSSLALQTLKSPSRRDQLHSSSPLRPVRRRLTFNLNSSPGREQPRSTRWSPYGSSSSDVGLIDSSDPDQLVSSAKSQRTAPRSVPKSILKSTPFPVSKYFSPSAPLKEITRRNNGGRKQSLSYHELSAIIAQAQAADDREMSLDAWNTNIEKVESSVRTIELSVRSQDVFAEDAEVLAGDQTRIFYPRPERTADEEITPLSSPLRRSETLISLREVEAAYAALSNDLAAWFALPALSDAPTLASSKTLATAFRRDIKNAVSHSLVDVDPFAGCISDPSSDDAASHYPTPPESTRKRGRSDLAITRQRTEIDVGKAACICLGAILHDTRSSCLLTDEDAEDLLDLLLHIPGDLTFNKSTTRDFMACLIYALHTQRLPASVTISKLDVFAKACSVAHQFHHEGGDKARRGACGALSIVTALMQVSAVPFLRYKDEWLPDVLECIKDRRIDVRLKAAEAVSAIAKALSVDMDWKVKFAQSHINDFRDLVAETLQLKHQHVDIKSTPLFQILEQMDHGVSSSNEAPWTVSLLAAMPILLGPALFEVEPRIRSKWVEVQQKAAKSTAAAKIRHIARYLWSHLMYAWFSPYCATSILSGSAPSLTTFTALVAVKRELLHPMKPTEQDAKTCQQALNNLTSLLFASGTSIARTIQPNSLELYDVMWDKIVQSLLPNLLESSIPQVQEYALQCMNALCWPSTISTVANMNRLIRAPLLDANLLKIQANPTLREPLLQLIQASDIQPSELPPLPREWLVSRQDRLRSLFIPYLQHFIASPSITIPQTFFDLLTGLLHFFHRPEITLPNQIVCLQAVTAALRANLDNHASQIVTHCADAILPWLQRSSVETAETQLDLYKVLLQAVTSSVEPESHYLSAVAQLLFCPLIHDSANLDIRQRDEAYQSLQDTWNSTFGKAEVLHYPASIRLFIRTLSEVAPGSWNLPSEDRPYSQINSQDRSELGSITETQVEVTSSLGGPSQAQAPLSNAASTSVKIVATPPKRLKRSYSESDESDQNPSSTVSCIEDSVDQSSQSNRKSRKRLKRSSSGLVFSHVEIPSNKKRKIATSSSLDNVLDQMKSSSFVPALQGAPTSSMHLEPVRPALEAMTRKLSDSDLITMKKVIEDEHARRQRAQSEGGQVA